MADQVSEPSDLCPGGQNSLPWSLHAAARAFHLLAGPAVAGTPGGARGYQVLSTVVRGRPRSQLALAQQLGIDKTVMTYLLDELEAAGLIERRADPADRRARQVLVTPFGSAALDSIGADLDTAEHALLAPLDDAEARAFRDMLERIAIAAQTWPSPPGALPTGAGPNGAAPTRADCP